MARFEWKEDLATGNELVDGQHKQLLEFANRFFEASHHAKGKLALKRSFELLEQHTQVHFHDEEQLYCQIGSRRLDDQRIEHGRMRSELKAIRSLWVSNFGFVKEVDRALTTWMETRLLPHIFEHDRQAFADRREPPD
jgi:hemerythrin